MDELDARLRAMAKREDWALPAAYESAMDGLEEQIRQGGDGGAHIADQDTGQLHLRVGGGAHIGNGPQRLGRLQKLPLEVGPLADKQGSGDDLAGVVRHQLHRRAAVGHSGGVFRQQPPAGEQIDIVLKGIGDQIHSTPRVVS